MIREIGYELLKMGHQKKNYIPLAGYILFVILCYIACVTAFDAIIKSIVAYGLEREEAAKYLDGIFFARMVQVPTLIVLMPIVMATLGGDCVAGEMQEGSLKLCLTRPRSRWRVIFCKFVAVYLAGLIYCMLFAVGGLVIGYCLFGLAPAQVVVLPARFFGAPVEIMSNWEVIIRYFAVAIYFSFSLMILGGMALLFSVIFNRMSAATIAVITLYFVSYIIAEMPFAVALRPIMMSEILSNAYIIFITPLPIYKLIINLATQGLYVCVMLLAAVIHFNNKDI